MKDAAPSEPPKKRRSRRSLAFRIAAVFAVLLALVAAAILIAPRLPSVRQAVLTRVSNAVEAASGIRFSADDFSITWRQAAVELHGVELAAPSCGAPSESPFLTVAQLRAEVRLLSLLSSRWTVQSLEVDSPRFDLGAPLPQRPSEERSEPSGRTVEILRFTITGGAVTSSPESLADDSWLESWRVEGIELQGSYQPEELAVDLSRATLEALRKEAAPGVDRQITFDVAGRLRGAPAGPWEIGPLTAEGDGLELSASAHVGFGADAPLQVNFELAADPARWITGRSGPGGRVEGQGDLDLRRWSGTAHWQAEAIPAELVEPWLGRATMVRMGAAGSHFDLEGDVDLDPAAAEELAVDADLVWRRGNQRLGEVKADVRGLRIAGGPGAKLAGEIHVAGTDWRAELLEPWLGADALDRAGAAGTHLDFDARLVLDGTHNNVGRAEVLWQRGADDLLRIVAAGQELRLTIAAEALPASPGKRRLDAELRVPDWRHLDVAEIAAGRLDLEAPDLGAAVAELHELWPRLVPAIDPRWPVDGSLSLAADLEGSVTHPMIDGEVTWLRDGAAVTLTASGEPLAIRGQARLTVADLDLASLRELAEAPGLAGRAGAVVEIAGSPSDWTGTLHLDAAGVVSETRMPSVDELILDAESDGTALRLTRLSARIGGRTVTGHGELTAAWPPRQAEFQAEIAAPVTGIDRVLLDTRFADGILELEASEIDAGSERGELRATIPLAGLRTVALSFSLPRLDAAALLRDLGVSGVPTTAEVAARGQLTVDLDDLTAARGTIEISHLTMASDEHRLGAGEPVRLQLADHRLEGEAPRLNVDGSDLAVTAAIDLRSGWQLGDPLAELAASLDATTTGTVEADLLNPYLGGAIASGPLQIELAVSGPPDNLGGRAKITGPEARLVARSPYFTRLENLEAEIEIEDGEAFLILGRARLNQGVLELTGFRQRDGEIELYADLENVRYRFDYGLGTALSAELALSLPGQTAAPAERGRLSGRLVVERGLTRRDLDLEREIVGLLLAPAIASAPDPDDLLAAIDLDLDVVTVDGVRIKNNLADVRTTWSPLMVRGTLAAPLIDGRLDVEPGGFVYVLGQTARIDQATVFLKGFPEVPPEIEVDMTTSLEDPSVARAGADHFSFATPQPTLTAAELEDRRQQLLTAGVASYYADQLAGRFGQVLGGTHIEVAPLLVFGETDPGARLTVSRDLSSHIAFAVSVDLNAENRQTYLLDLHDFRPVPRLTAQLFTNDERNQGVTLQQSFTFGGSEEDETRPRIRRVRVEAPEGFDSGGVRAAADLGKGDRFPEGAEFDIEVDVAEHLRQRGFPGAEVSVRIEPVDESVDLVVTLAPGPEVIYEFRGDALPRVTRRTIRRLYRTDVFEQAAIEEMRLEAVGALHSLGHPMPEVDVAAIPEDPSAPRGDRTVVIDARAGERRPIVELELRGVPAEVATQVGAGFEAQGDRIELAAAREDSDQRLLGMLRRLGYPEAGITERRLDAGAATLIVEIDPGKRPRIVDVRIEGIIADSLATDGIAAEDRVVDAMAAEEARLRKLLPFAIGDPVRSDRIARGTVALEGDLRGRGYADARAWAITAPRSPDAGDEIVLTYRLEPGTRYRIREIRFDGAEATGTRWAERVADLEKGAPVDPSDVGDARRRLFETGLFRSVVPDTERGSGGAAAVVFALQERPRFQLSYGLRWESSEGGGVVVDAVDRNAFGRGVTLGLRALWSSDETSTRAYSAFPKVFGTRATLELFAEIGESRQSGRLVDRTESTLQVSVPLSVSTTTRGYLRYRDSRFLEPDSGGDFTRVKDPILGWQLVRDTRNDKIDATRGLLASTDLTGASSALGGDSRFLRFLGKLSVFRPIARRGGRPGRRTAVTWAQSWRLGWAEAFGGQQLSPDERFFAGGELSVRGYGNDSLGPVSATGVPIGGEALLVVNQELRFPVWKSIRGLLFVDAGNVWQDGGDLGFDFFTAAGLGLRVSTPVGLVRFDVAMPLDRRPQDDDVKLYLGLGNVF